VRRPAESDAGGVTFLADLLAYLREQGFTVGVDTYARARRLMEHSGARPPEDLKTILGPIFVNNPKQQEQFATAFDDYVRHLPARLVGRAPSASDTGRGGADVAAVPKPRGRVRRRRLVAAAVLLAVAAALVAAWQLWPAPAQEEVTDPTAQINNDPPPVADVPGESTSTENLPEESAPPALYLLVAAACLACFILWRLWRALGRRLALSRRPTLRPPTFWPLRVAASARKIYDADGLYRAARLLRRRQVAEYQRLDIGATIHATVGALGYPVFRYKPDTRAPEYLVLIDRASPRDHQSRLFDELAAALEREGLFVARYFYEGDPRVCRDEAGADCLQLAELRRRHAGHRLLIFGDGRHLIDPVKGGLAAWAGMFSEWQERALLTPEPRWGLREVALAEQFSVLPATLEGLVALSDRFESLLKTNLAAWPRDEREAATPEGEGLHDPRALREHLGDAAYRWLCACAVYTELQWELTLHLGSLPFLGDAAVTERNLLRLVRLPWFRSGSIPDELRLPLIEDLAPSERAAVRAALVEFLERDAPPAHSFAADRRELELAVQRWLLDGDAESLERLRETAAARHPERILRDRTLVHYLGRAPNPALDLLLPRRLRKHFFPGGVPLLGLKPGAALGITALFILLSTAAVGAGVFPLQSALQASLRPAPDERADVTPEPSPTPGTTPTPDTKPTPEPSPTPPAYESPTPPAATADTAENPNQIPSNLPTRARANRAPSRNKNRNTGRAGGALAATEVTGGPPRNVNSSATFPHGQEGVANPSNPAPLPSPTSTPPKPIPPSRSGTNDPSPAPTPTSPGLRPSQTSPPVPGGVLNGKAISAPRPTYPSAAKAARAGGPVTVQVTLDEAGRVISAQAVSGPKLLRGPAVEAVRKWRFSTTTISGQPVKVTGTVTVNFTLK
jgi:TonB family protein